MAGLRSVNAAKEVMCRGFERIRATARRLMHPRWQRACRKSATVCPCSVRALAFEAGKTMRSDGRLAAYGNP
jgi:hypothetical protein